MEERAEASEKTILIVDDDESICVFLKTLLDREGFRTEVAYRGDSAVKTVESGKIDLIILDWMMPILSGFEVLKMLQADEHRSIPVLVITARAADHSTISMIRQEINVVDFMPKPIKHAVFVSRIHQILGTISNDEKKIREAHKDFPGANLP